MTLLCIMGVLLALKYFGGYLPREYAIGLVVFAYVSLGAAVEVCVYFLARARPNKIKGMDPWILRVFAQDRRWRVGGFAFVVSALPGPWGGSIGIVGAVTGYPVIKLLLYTFAGGWVRAFLLVPFGLLALRPLCNNPVFAWVLEALCI
ncbi:MAG: hypothetical protein Q8P39_02465 [Candidatus Yanofskybacteria bacterium]|nr:hypothetical protein [Candidatus Yanofskybacteria bacterium]